MPYLIDLSQWFIDLQLRQRKKWLEDGGSSDGAQQHGPVGGSTEDRKQVTPADRPNDGFTLG
jgi:hypothetical protein